MIQISITPKVIETPRKFWRIPNDIERIPGTLKFGGDGYRLGKARKNAVDSGKTIPQVFRVWPSQVVPLSCGFVRLLRAMHPKLSLEKVGLILDNHWAFANTTGWPGRYNCLTGALSNDPENPYKPPAYHASLLCGGAVLAGVKSGDLVYFESLAANDPAPDLEYMDSHPWLWYWGTQVNPDGVPTHLTFGGIDGTRQWIRLPFVTAFPPCLPADELDELPDGFFPTDALWMPG